jgi:uncharacterized protein YwqG
MPTKQQIEFEQAAAPITAPITKFGGQPVWLADPQWPLSRQTGNPMRFICQIALSESMFPHTPARMAYLFMTDEEDGEFVDGTYEPDGGENAVILQPGNAPVPTTDVAQGPTLYRMVEKPGHDRLQREPCEFAVKLMEEEDASATNSLEENKIGGAPAFLQGEEFPFEGHCLLLLQLDSCSVPFYVNFGDAGVGYAFLNEQGDRAKFLWQCG